ncbi:MAG: penicillin acylase family protein, partial [Candidatus Zixiibacteriota bacterium]
MLKPKVKKIISFILISIIGIFIGVAVSFYVFLKLSLPITEGKLELSGLSHPVEITYDRMGVPQIWAETTADAYFALGYQHAADRMFQMDLARRLAQGKLSEMLGSITVEIDIEQRQIGHYRLAAKALETLSEKNKQRLQAYTDGVNAYKNNCRALPFEYRFLPIDFEDWTIVDCLAFLSFQTWFSNSLMSRDEFYFSLFRKVGKEKAKSLFFEYPDWAPTTIPSKRQQLNIFDSLFLNDGKSYSSNMTPDKEKPVLPEDSKASLYQPFQRAIAQTLFDNDNLPFQLTHSSNAWVIAPEKSISGKAMLASDPHLELTRLPQFWYAVGLHIKNDSVNVLGITTPGLPFVIMGHNGQCAWAFTAGGLDITEYYVETINPENSNQYYTQDGWREFELLKDSILIAGIDSFKTVTHKFSRNGLIVSEDKNLKAAYALHWAGYDMDLNVAVTNAFHLHQIKNFEQFQKAVTNFGALDANMMYADADGNIGYQLTTPLPVRSDEKGYLPVNESNNDNRWNGYYPLEETPFMKNPQCGWLANCNN